MIEVILLSIFGIVLLGVVCFGAALLCFAGVARLFFGKGWLSKTRVFISKTVKEITDVN